MEKTQTNRFVQSYRVGIKNDLPAIMDYVQQACLHHTYSTPGGMKFYDDAQLAWVLTHWQVEIASLPQIADVINVETWSAGHKGFFGERGFDVKGADGKTIINANSNWMLVSRQNLKPARPKDEIAQKYGEPSPLLIKKDFAMPKVEDFEHFASHKYKVTKRDIDDNDHVNNISYLTWVWDLIELEEGKEVPTGLKVAYKKEVLLNDVVEINLYKRGEYEVFVIIENDEKIATEIYLSWKKENGESLS